MALPIARLFTFVASTKAKASEVNAEFNQLVDAVNNELVRIVGSTMTGTLTLSGAPTSDLHAATKKYIDDLEALLVLLDGTRVMTGDFLMGANDIVTTGLIDTLGIALHDHGGAAGEGVKIPISSLATAVVIDHSTVSSGAGAWDGSVSYVDFPTTALETTFTPASASNLILILGQFSVDHNAQRWSAGQLKIDTIPVADTERQITIQNSGEPTFITSIHIITNMSAASHTIEFETKTENVSAGNWSHTKGKLICLEISI